MEINKSILTFLMQSEDMNTTAVNKKLHNEIRSYIEKVYNGTSVSVGLSSYGDTRYAPTYIAFLLNNNTVKCGIYPVVLYYRKIKKLVIAYGISSTSDSDFSWNWEKIHINQPQTIEDLFKTNSWTDSKKKYYDSFVYSYYDVEQFIEDYKDIDLTEVDSVDDILDQYSFNFGKDIDIIIQKYKMMFNLLNDIKHADPEQDVKSFDPLQKIYFGTPGGGKSHKVKTLIEITKKAKDRCFRTTFHPDTDYASFVGSYKPVMKGELICYKYVPQVFTLAYIAAWNDLDNEYFLDIEEINRGNCAQIFGDLFQLLDRNKEGYSEYPIQADSDLAEYLLNAQDEDDKDILCNKDGIDNNRLCLPPNLSIVATMNTSDQSLFPMDSAFKRRWDWEFVPSTFNEKDNYNITLGKKVYKWHTFLKEANARIKQATDSEDKQMGSYFVKTDMDEEKFKSKVMYYLWSEICKEEYKTQNNFFRYIDNEKNEQEFTFNELYGDGSTKMLQKFMKFMNVSPVNGDETDEEDKEDEE